MFLAKLYQNGKWELRRLAIRAAEEGVSLNQYILSKVTVG
jgi:predicted HicB family RNase H-like nuclease